MNEEMLNGYEVSMVYVYLNRARDARRYRDRLKARADNLRMLLTDTAAHFAEKPHGGSPDRQRDQTIQAEIDETEQKIKAAEVELDAIRQEIGMTICKIPDPVVQKVMIYRFLDEQPWKDVADKIGYSVPRAYQLRDEGIRALAGILKERDGE